MCFKCEAGRHKWLFLQHPQPKMKKNIKMVIDVQSPRGAQYFCACVWPKCRSQLVCYTWVYCNLTVDFFFSFWHEIQKDGWLFLFLLWCFQIILSYRSFTKQDEQVEVTSLSLLMLFVVFWRQQRPHHPNTESFWNVMFIRIH